MIGYVYDVKPRNWVVLCLQNVSKGKTIYVDTQAFYFSTKKQAIEFAEDKSGEYLVYVYKRVRCFLPWSKRLARDLFGCDD